MSELESMMLDLALAGWIGGRANGGRISSIVRLGGYGWDDYENVIRSQYEKVFFCGRLHRYRYIDVGRVIDFGGRMWMLNDEVPTEVRARLGSELLARRSGVKSLDIMDQWILFGFVPLDWKQ